MRSGGFAFRVWLLSLLALLPAEVAVAHPVDAATLTLVEQAEGRFVLHFQAGSRALQQELARPATFPPPCRQEANIIECGPAGISGRLEFPWLEGTLTRLQVVIEWRAGARLVRVVSAQSPWLAVYGPSASLWGASRAVLADYTKLGIEHILGGFDHLCFVMALLVLVRSRAKLIGTITAFTAAHSLTLALTALGLVHLPAAPVEALIALSIVHVCAECLRPEGSLTRRFPWVVAFSFGLLHGLGFASALLEVGLPERHLGLALFGFNLGVEVGQLGVVLAASGVVALGVRLGWARVWVPRAAVYLMGSVAAFWSLDRLVQMLS